MDWRSIFEKKETKIGLYSTVIFHLVLIIVLLITTIGGVVSEETAFVLDFTGQERLEEEIRRNEIKEQASREIEDLLAGRQTVQYRNVAVDRNTRNLKDDRFKNPNQVYDEARELQKSWTLPAARHWPNRGRMKFPEIPEMKTGRNRRPIRGRPLFHIH